MKIATRKNKIRTYKITWKTLNEKNHGQRKRKCTKSKIGIRGESCERLQQKHNRQIP